MDRDVRAEKPGVCPRCGMKLVLKVPDIMEFPLEVSHSPDRLSPEAEATFTFRVRAPGGRLVDRFEIVHEKLLHVFLVSENLEFFAHVHPEPGAGGTFQLKVRFPFGGMYRLLADYYPARSAPQLATKTFFVSGASSPARLVPGPASFKADNVSALLQLDPRSAIAGLETRLTYTIDPAAGFEPYLGAWGHMLAVSDDLVDFLHVHPFLADGGPRVQFNLVFPRPRFYRIWTQFQRRGVVNTIVSTIGVRALERILPG